MSGFARTAGLAASFVLLAVLSGCQTVQVANVPEKAPVYIDDRSELAPIKLNRVGVKMRRGTVIGSYKYDPFGCIPHHGNVYWNRGRLLMKNTEFEDIFFEQFDGANFNVVGDPDDLFAGVKRDDVEPEYLIGGQIEDIRMNICDYRPFIYLAGSVLTPKQSGSASLTVTWQVYSLFDEKVVYKAKTAGSV